MNSYSNYNPYSTTSYSSNGPADGGGGGFYGGGGGGRGGFDDNAGGGEFGSPGSASKVSFLIFSRLSEPLTINFSALDEEKILIYSVPEETPFVL
jgi:hypothetical protein